MVKEADSCPPLPLAQLLMTVPEEVVRNMSCGATKVHD